VCACGASRCETPPRRQAAMAPLRPWQWRADNREGHGPCDRGQGTRCLWLRVCVLLQAARRRDRQERRPRPKGRGLAGVCAQHVREVSGACKVSARAQASWRARARARVPSRGDRRAGAMAFLLCGGRGWPTTAVMLCHALEANRAGIEGQSKQATTENSTKRKDLGYCGAHRRWSKTGRVARRWLGAEASPNKSAEGHGAMTMPRRFARLRVVVSCS
jgi:hypothetical protein